jgi:hypothetical protein
MLEAGRGDEVRVNPIPEIPEMGKWPNQALQRTALGRPR